MIAEKADARPFLRVGCAIWANRQWIGRQFPSDTPSGRELTAYTSWCNAVEGNTSFYGLPSLDTVLRWNEDTPDDFRFVFKLPRTITHDRRLRNAENELAEALRTFAPLGPKADPMSIQLPATFGPDDLDVLGRFLAAAPTDRTWAVEVRHPAMCDGGTEERRLNDLLAERGAERVIIDTRAVFAGPRDTDEEREAFERKPRLPVRPVAIGARPVVRFIGQTAPEPNPQWWSKWVPKVAAWLDQGRTPTFFVHTPDNLVGPELARRFHAEVGALVPDLRPLPTPATSSTQLKLL